MKKHLIMIVGGYYPNPSPTGKCAEQYISLLQDEYDVEVLCIGSQHIKNYEFEYKNKRIHALSGLRLFLETKAIIRTKNAKNVLLKYFYKLQVLFLKGFGRIETILLMPNNHRWYYKKAFKELKRIYESSKIDIVFSVGAPFASHMAARKFKSKYNEVKWAAYTVDSFSEQYINTFKYKRALKLEKETLKEADVNFSSEDIISNSSIYANCITNPIELPYLLDIKSINHHGIIKKDCNKHYLVYAGRFYKDLREPKPMLNKLKNVPNIHLDIYSEGAFSNEIDLYNDKNDVDFKRFNFISINELMTEYAKADCLISLGNNNLNFQPSKIYELIAIGKPIIHFYYLKKDDTLLKYPSALQISVNSDIDESNLISDFLNKATDVSKQDIEKIYFANMPSNIAKLIKENL